LRSSRELSDNWIDKKESKNVGRLPLNVIPKKMNKKPTPKPNVIVSRVVSPKKKVIPIKYNPRTINKNFSVYLLEFMSISAPPKNDVPM